MRPVKEINQRIGRNIQHARTKAGLTQEILSEKIGLTPNHLSAIERGTAGASLETIEKLCVELRISADFILFGEVYSESPLLHIAQRLYDAAPNHRQQIVTILNTLLDMLAAK